MRRLVILMPVVATRRNRPRNDVLEPCESRDWELHGEGDVHRGQVHEREQPPASVWDRGRRK
jgi:hypothetical protein